MDSRPEVVQILLQRGACDHQADIDGYSACENNRHGTIEEIFLRYNRRIVSNFKQPLKQFHFTSMYALCFHKIFNGSILPSWFIPQHVFSTQIYRTSIIRSTN